MKTSECTTCYRNLPLAHFPEAPDGLDCKHERSTCKRCWGEWLKLKVQTVRFDQITCPQCENLLDQNAMRALATTEVYQKYLDAEFRATLAADPDFKWCLSPTCTSGQVHFEGDIFRCVNCGFKMCVYCNVAWHEDETCEAFQARRNIQPEQEIASAKALKKTSKDCPTCDRKLEKNGGCDHMRCKCGTEFCWFCLADYRDIRKEGNSAHNKSCIHWRKPGDEDTDSGGDEEAYSETDGEADSHADEEAHSVTDSEMDSVSAEETDSDAE